jgi:hypothetical protein
MVQLRHGEKCGRGRGSLQGPGSSARPLKHRDVLTKTSGRLVPQRGAGNKSDEEKTVTKKKQRRQSSPTQPCCVGGPCLRLGHCKESTWGIWDAESWISQQVLATACVRFITSFPCWPPNSLTVAARTVLSSGWLVVAQQKQK